MTELGHHTLQLPYYLYTNMFHNITNCWMDKHSNSLLYSSMYTIYCTYMYIDRWNAIDISVIRLKFAISSRIGLSSVILETSLFYRHSLALIHRGSQFTGNPLSTGVRQIFRCTNFFSHNSPKWPPVEPLEANNRQAERYASS